MKKIVFFLMMLGLLQLMVVLVIVLMLVLVVIVEYNGLICIVVICNFGFDDNIIQFVVGVLQEGKKFGFKISIFLSNGDDVKFQDFVNQVISQKYDGIIFFQGCDLYFIVLVKKVVDVGIKVVVFDIVVSGEIFGVMVSQQDDVLLIEFFFGQLVKDFNGKVNIVKLWVVGFLLMECCQVVYQMLLK